VWIVNEGSWYIREYGYKSLIEKMYERIRYFESLGLSFEPSCIILNPELGIPYESNIEL
jgi:hypothetical protein